MVRVSTCDSVDLMLSEQTQPNENTISPPAKKRGRPKGAKGKSKAEQVAESITYPAEALDRSSHCIAFDIETGPSEEIDLSSLFDQGEVKVGNLKDPEKIAEKRNQAFRDFYERAALSPITGKVLAAGVSYSNGFMHIHATDNEASTLHAFWKHVNVGLKERLPIVGWNIFDFDLPFLVNRSRLLGVLIPAGVIHGRYWNDLFIDLMKVWTCFRHGEYEKIDRVAKAFGLAGKLPGFEAKDFHLVLKNDRQRALDYLTQDVLLVQDLWQRIM